MNVGNVGHTANVLETGWTLVSLTTCYFAQRVLRTRIRDWRNVIASGLNGVYLTLARGRIRTVVVYLFTSVAFVVVGLAAMLTPPNTAATRHGDTNWTAILLTLGIFGINILILLDVWLMGRERQHLIDERGSPLGAP